MALGSAGNSITSLLWLYDCIYIHANLQETLHWVKIDMEKTCLNGNVIGWLIQAQWNIQSHILVNENGQSWNGIGTRGSGDSLFWYATAECVSYHVGVQ